MQWPVACIPHLHLLRPMCGRMWDLNVPGAAVSTSLLCNLATPRPKSSGLQALTSVALQVYGAGSSNCFILA